MSHDVRRADRVESGIAILERVGTGEHAADPGAQPLRRDRSARGVADDGPASGTHSTEAIGQPIEPAAEGPIVVSTTGAPLVPASPPVRVTVPTTPPGWYPDPADSRGLRWWTGIGWTDHTTAVAPGGASTVPDSAESTAGGATPKAAGAAGSTAAAPWAVEALTGGDTGTETTDPGATRSEPGERPGTRSGAGRTPSVFTPLGPTRVHTVAVWILALSPLIMAAGEHAIAGSLTGYGAMTIRIAGAITIVALSLVLAVIDRSRLRDGWHSDTASPWWVLLTPFAYLIGRTVRVRQETGVRATGMSLVWLLTLLPAIAIAFGWDGVGPVMELLDRI